MFGPSALHGGGPATAEQEREREKETRGSILRAALQSSVIRGRLDGLGALQRTGLI